MSLFKLPLSPSAGAPSLAFTLVWFFLLPLLLMVAVIGWLGIAQLERHSEERMRKDIELVARAIRLPLSHALERGYRRTVQQALDSAFSIDRVYGAYVYDSAGEILAASGHANSNMLSDQASRIASQGERQGRFGQLAGEAVYSYFVPLTDSGGRISGLLQVTRQASEFDDYISTLRHKSLIGLLLLGLLLAGLLMLGYRWALGRHLGRMQAGLKRIGAGDLHYRLNPDGPRELRHLSASINAMLNAIARSAEQLDNLSKRLHQAEKMAALGQLSAGVAHELGSPLSTIDGRVQRLSRRDDLPEAVRHALRVIAEEAHRMERIIRQLLDFGRNNPLQLRSIDCQAPLHAACALLQKQSPVPIHVEPGMTSVELLADRVRLDQALSNLLLNAIQAARGGVWVQTERDGGWLTYRIDDDGPGIAAEHLPHLFEPFFTTKAVGQGTGLGLAVAHAAAKDHGGEIEVAESPRGGARFRLRLPLHPEAA